MAVKEKLSGSINPFFKCNNVYSAGTMVKISNDEVIVASGIDGQDIYGMLAQDVIAASQDVWKSDTVTAVARVGDRVGVYFNGGVYETDQTSVDITAGDLLYVDESANAGKLTNIAVNGDTSARVAVGLAETTATAGNFVRVKLFI